MSHGFIKSRQSRAAPLASHRDAQDGPGRVVVVNDPAGIPTAA